MVAAAIETFGGLDIAFNNAGGTGSNGSVTDLDESEWNSILSLNVTSVFLA